MAKTICAAVKELRLAKDASAVEEALKGVVAESVGDAKDRDDFCSLVESVLSDEVQWNVTAKLRRKLRRTLDAYRSHAEHTTESKAAPGGLKEAQSTSKVAAELEERVEPLLVDWEALICSVRNASSADNLEEVISSVDWSRALGSSSCASRRALRRALEGVLKGAGQDGGLALNAKARRRVSRLLAQLAPGALVAATLVEEKPQERARSPQAEPPSKRPKLSKPPAPAPPVLFVGQLPFSATAADVQQLFEAHLGGAEALGGPLSVRLLTEERDPSVSRGLAFVTLPSESLLPRALALHHAVLGGRCINVERSVSRGEQRRLRGEVDSLLRSASPLLSLDVLSPTFAAQLLAYPSHTLQQAVQQLKQRAPGERSAGQLDQLLRTLHAACG
eukprot:gene26451-31968_t